MYLLYINWKRAENVAATVFTDAAKTYTNTQYTAKAKAACDSYFSYVKLNITIKTVQPENRTKNKRSKLLLL